MVKKVAALHPEEGKHRHFEESMRFKERRSSEENEEPKEHRYSEERERRKERRSSEGNEEPKEHRYSEGSVRFKERRSFERDDRPRTLSYFGGHYEAVRLLYDSPDTRVWLVRHRALGAERILKRVKKSNYASLEAQILLSLRHPGIPILYDYEEDENSICLLEEVVRGVSLREYLEEANHIPFEEAFDMAVQICEIVEYLHEGAERPILYLDMKPEHIYLRGDQILLIDYSTSLLRPRSGQTIQKYGTKQYSAPEAYQTGIVDERSDIYAAAKVIEELFAHCDSRVPGKIKRQISRALSEDVGRRPSTMGEFRKNLEKSFIKENSGDSLRCEIAVSGNDHSVGCTHIAISLVVFFNARREKACFVNDTGQPITQYFCRANGSFTEKDGYIVSRLFRACADDEMSTDRPVTADVIVRDCGRDVDRAKEADLWIHVVGSRPWKDQELDIATLIDADGVLINPANPMLGRTLARTSGNPVMGFPSNDDPFGLSREKRRVLEKMMSKVNGSGRSLFC